jgi:hypothetical protein
MPLDTLQQISDALDQHSVRITTAQSTADTANTEAARALSRIYDVDLGATLYTDNEIEKIKTLLRQEFNQSLTNTFNNIDATLVDRINNQVPGMLLDRYGSYSQMVALNDALLHRFGQSDAAITTLLDTTIPGLLGTVNQLSTQSDNVAQDLNLLQNALKSVLVVYAADAAGSDQSLTPGNREYVQYVEYNGTPPTLPVTGTFTKFVGVGQSTWPIYASSSSGQNQSFEPGSRTYVTFYNSPTQPVLPVTGETFVRYIGTDGADGNPGADGPRGAGRWMIPVSTLPTSSTAAKNAWNAAGSDIPDRPVINDQVIFYTGTVGNPTSQKAYICQWVTSDVNHGWSYQQFLMRGNLLVTGSVTADQIDSRGLTIRDENNNIILQATGGSAGINLSKVIGAGNFAGLNQINQSNVSTYIAAAAISSAYIGDLSASKITTGALNAARISLNGLMLENNNGALQITSGGVNTTQLANNAATVLTYALSTSSSDNIGGNNSWHEFLVPSPWIDSDGLPVTVSFLVEGDVSNTSATNEIEILQGNTIVYRESFTQSITSDLQFFVSGGFTWTNPSSSGTKWSLRIRTSHATGLQNVNGSLSVQVLKK